MPNNVHPTGFITTIHEERIRRLEEKSVEQATEHAEISSEFKNVAVQISALKTSVDEGVKGLSTQMTELHKTVQTHATFIDNEKEARDLIAKRKGKIWKSVGLIALPLLGAVGANSGKSIYEWIVRMING